MNIRVVQQEGQGVSFSSVAIRNLIRAVDGLGMYSVAVISMFITQKVQRLGDIAAGTVVISEEMPEYSASYDKKNTVTIDHFDDKNNNNPYGLTDEELSILRNYWSRRNEFDLDTRERLISKLLLPIAERLNLEIRDHTVISLEHYLKEMLQ